MFKKITSLLLALLLALSVSPSLAASKKKAPKPSIIYKARITSLFNGSGAKVYSKPDKNSKSLAHLAAKTPINIVEVNPMFVTILMKNGRLGYVFRHRIENAEPVDPKSTPRFGTVLNRFYARIGRDTPVHAGPDSKSEALITLHEGAMIGFIDIENGWALTIFKRQYGYVDTRLLDEILPVASSVETADAKTPIAVYNSFYNIADTELNRNRMVNLEVCAKRANRVMQPGDVLDFNNSVGPFRPGNGYLQAGALMDGKWGTAYGGGSCQASSTLYNVVLQLTGITVLVRAPHGANGAKYLPHGVDASSGNLNFKFRNDYDFPITIQSHVQDGSLYFAFYKGE